MSPNMLLLKQDIQLFYYEWLRLVAFPAAKERQELKHQSLVKKRQYSQEKNIRFRDFSRNIYLLRTYSTDTVQYSTLLALCTALSEFLISGCMQRQLDSPILERTFIKEQLGVRMSHCMPCNDPPPPSSPFLERKRRDDDADY